MNELNKKLAEWAGFELHKGPYYETRIASDGQDKWLEEIRYTQYWRIGKEAYLELPDFTDDLTACFEHLEPELYRRGFRYQLTRLQDGHRAIIFAPSKAWADIVADAVADNPALAFCKAVEQLMEKK